jgi:hypothetical protein
MKRSKQVRVKAENPRRPPSSSEEPGLTWPTHFLASAAKKRFRPLQYFSPQPPIES